MPECLLLEAGNHRTTGNQDVLALSVRRAQAEGVKCRDPLVEVVVIQRAIWDRRVDPRALGDVMEEPVM